MIIITVLIKEGRIYGPCPPVPRLLHILVRVVIRGRVTNCHHHHQPHIDIDIVIKIIIIIFIIVI